MPNMEEFKLAIGRLDEARQELGKAIAREEHPNRIADYVRDCERWLVHARNHLAS